HLEREIKQNTPELRKAQTNHDNIQRQIRQLSETVNEAEDEVFEAFCRRIRISNIREYEERQLKLAQEESEARLRFEQQIARLTHQFEYESEGLEKTRERLDTQTSILNTERANLEKLQKQKEIIEAELAEAEEGIAGLKEELKGLQETLDEKTKIVEQ
ncbi:hypothetical protein MPER_13717, partial [Moniliophthora perniciosa FA553]